MPEQSAIPLFRRGYATYAPSQIEQLEEHLQKFQPEKIFDPFMGRGSYLRSLAPRGYRVLGVELLPPLWLLGQLDSLAGDQRSTAAVREVRSLLLSLPSVRDDLVREPVDDWLGKRQHAELECVRDSLDGFAIPRVWRERADPVQTLLAGVVVAAARLYAGWRTSKNATWPRPGGVPLRASVAEASLEVLDLWAERIRFEKRFAAAKVICADFLEAPKLHDVDLLVTSPPYANGMNYARMWGPELSVADALALSSRDEDDRQLGVRTRGYELSSVSCLPKSTQRQLDAIAASPVKDSATYYYRRFARYATELHASLRRLTMYASPSASLLIFSRDTRHHDVLFKVSDLIVDVLTSEGWVEIERRESVVRTHIGLRRPRRAATVYGDAQIECALSFARS